LSICRYSLWREKSDVCLWDSGVRLSLGGAWREGKVFTMSVVNGSPSILPVSNGKPGTAGVSEEERARQLAERYRCDFITLSDYAIDHELFHSIPVDLMFRYNFVPLRSHGGTLDIAMADPSQLMMIDEVSLLLDKRLVVHVATLSQISEYLKKTEQSQRVLE